MGFENVADSFGQKARQYDRCAPLQKEVARKLARQLPGLGAPDILEIGCGTGFLTAALFQKYKDGRFHITDIAPEMVSVAAEKFHGDERAVFEVMDGENPSLEKQYDLIVSSMAVQWFASPQKSLKALQKHLKPEGRLYYATLGQESFAEWRAVTQEAGVSSGLLALSAWPGIISEEKIEIDYGDALGFLKALKAIGAHQPAENYTPLHPAAMRRVCRHFDETYQGRIRWHIVYGCLEAQAKVFAR
ncbi:MAG: methyltransferase [Rhodospirillales bacterium]|nr:methyltransferase [Alphaproteobacteria bacterium]USO03177.1 MAG: methyltransferase [Rhodospirillales bacterium]